MLTNLGEMESLTTMPFVAQLHRHRGVSAEVRQMSSATCDENWVNFVKMLVHRFGIRAVSFYHVFSEYDEHAVAASRRMQCTAKRTDWLVECIGEAAVIIAFVEGLKPEELEDGGFPLNEVVLFSGSDVMVEISDHGRIALLYDISTDDASLLQSVAPMGSTVAIVSSST